MDKPFSLAQFRLDGRVALVTGAGSGLGAVFARALATVGAAVVCADIDGDSARETADAIADAGGNGWALGSDVADETSATGMIAQTLERAGRLDVLVNNAGISTRPARIHEMPVADWDRLMAVNLRGVFLVTRAALPAMRAAGSGNIINIASVAGLVGVSPEQPAVSANYSAAKAGVIGFTRQLAVEYGREGIRANAIAPGWHLGTQLGREAPMLNDQAAIAAFLEHLHRQTPMGRTGDPEELAGLVVYLASDASSFVTGQVMTQDGGWTTW